MALALALALAPTRSFVKSQDTFLWRAREKTTTRRRRLFIKHLNNTSQGPAYPGEGLDVATMAARLHNRRSLTMRPTHVWAGR
ncbi:hypothetical protein SODALDRAFT_330123 [Sodiomyces alkalinus F11]|uniref:Uncharacterized protein n=1 Tax=Sodiomyces alkalinus (strain CBS 110278 / VKM F-3762 / F11) TaxID=1314773 RepID=A0A3N2Q0V8_SODAK|nr:hypothetical protein SODALDRAFT_330123 [Sodiomyces alkalinus F11]ROT40404.1 hypothetical protein SODALDRAFT_330123 [Sodiomyces alkalinus F11]